MLMLPLLHSNRGQGSRAAAHEAAHRQRSPASNTRLSEPGRVSAHSGALACRPVGLACIPWPWLPPTLIMHPPLHACPPHSRPPAPVPPCSARRPRFPSALPPTPSLLLLPVGAELEPRRAPLRMPPALQLVQPRGGEQIVAEAAAGGGGEPGWAAAAGTHDSVMAGAAMPGGAVGRAVGSMCGVHHDPDCQRGGRADHHPRPQRPSHRSATAAPHPLEQHRPHGRRPSLTTAPAAQHLQRPCR